MDYFVFCNLVYFPNLAFFLRIIYFSTAIRVFLTGFIILRRPTMTKMKGWMRIIRLWHVRVSKGLILIGVNHCGFFVVFVLYMVEL